MALWLKNMLGLKPTQQEFVGIAISHLKSKLPNIQKIEFIQEEYSIQTEFGEHETMKYFLGNAYDEYCAERGAKRIDVLNAFFAAPSFKHPEDLQSALPDILPRVLERASLESVMAQLKTASRPATFDDRMAVQFKILAEHLCISLAYDTPTNIQTINDGMLNSWQTTFDTVMPSALENLSKRTPEPFKALKPGLYMSQYSDTHDASRILLTERITECKTMGRAIVMMPNRNVLLIAGESDPDALDGLLKIAESTREQPRPMLAIPLVLSGDTWHEWKVRPDHPHKFRFEMLRATSFSDIYAAQGNFLESTVSEDLFVAQFFVLVKEENKEIKTMSSWTKGVPTLLPKTSTIAFTDTETNKIKMVPWAVAEETVGHLMKPQGMYPERYRVDSFPSQAELDQMPEK